MMAVEVEVHLCDLATGKPLRRFPGPVGTVCHLGLSPDGKTLVGTWSQGDRAEKPAVLAWDVESAKPLWEWALGTGATTFSRTDLTTLAFFRGRQIPGHRLRGKA
jgi:WD40 repeat protein